MAAVLMFSPSRTLPNTLVDILLSRSRGPPNISYHESFFANNQTDEKDYTAAEHLRVFPLELCEEATGFTIKLEEAGNDCHYGTKKHWAYDYIRILESNAMALGTGN